MEITAEFENWRRIRDSDGSEGWVYHSMLSGKRTAVVYLKAKDDLAPIHPRTTLKAESWRNCSPAWSPRSSAAPAPGAGSAARGFDGWIEQTHLWGVYPNEKIE